MNLIFVARFCSSKDNPSICLSKITVTGSASYSTSLRETLLNGSLLCTSVFVHLSFIRQCDTVLARSSVCTSLRFSSAISILRMAIQRHLSDKKDMILLCLVC